VRRAFSNTAVLNGRAGDYTLDAERLPFSQGDPCDDDRIRIEAPGLIEYNGGLNQQFS
jgi:hypothetical protein